MPATFDPNLPATNSPMSSAEMRGQLNALKALTDDCQGSLSAAINSQSAGLPSHVDELNLIVSNPPTRAEVQAIADKMDELLEVLKRL